MALPNAKELKKLVKACRSAGIKTFKCPDFEFTLSDSDPITAPNRVTEPLPDSVKNAPVKSSGWDEMSEESKLFWSADFGQEAPSAQ